jgi:transposase InsO family protein
MDCFSRYVLSWELCNTLEAAFCSAALEVAFGFGQPLPQRSRCGGPQ